MSASYKVWGDYCHPRINEIWEGEMPSGDLRSIYDEGYNLEHCCSEPSSGPVGSRGEDVHCYVFKHKDYPDIGSSCSLCGWVQGASESAGTRDTICIRVPRGIRHLYATHRENVLRDLFNIFDDDGNRIDDIFDIDDDPDGM